MTERSDPTKPDQAAFALRSFLGMKLTTMGPGDCVASPTGTLQARATVLRSGRRVVQLQARVTVDGELVATGEGAFAVFDSDRTTANESAQPTG